MQYFSEENECWNAEKYEGKGAGPKDQAELSNINTVSTYLGGFGEELPNSYFDVVFSISVVEHVPNDVLPAFFDDIARVLKPGGSSYHAIDLYLFDESRKNLDHAHDHGQRVELYQNAYRTGESGMHWRETPKINRDLVFATDFATNSDRTMLLWNKIAPRLSDMRAIAQSVSLKAEWYKAEN